MGNISLLDCTLRDGGYINDWHFGEKAIKTICKKLSLAGIEYLEVGFVRDLIYDKEYSLFDGNESAASIITPKSSKTRYVGMIDMGNPVSLDRLGQRRQDGFDVLRVIFKKNKIDNAFSYIQEALKLGYEVFAQPVGADQYSFEEFRELACRFNKLPIRAFYIVDSFGLIKKKHFLKLVDIADDVLNKDIMLGYHSHNNMQQAMGNATAMTERTFERDIILDACVFGMGRGAGNLNMELFAEYMNENFAKHYRIEPMLEIIDEYLNPIYREHFWGYSLPLYLSAANGCHPNYAIYFASKGSLTVKSYNEILKSISTEDKAIYSEKRAEEYYQQYQENYIDDAESIDALLKCLNEKKILLLGSGKSLHTQKKEIAAFIEKESPVVISLNFVPEQYRADFVFCCHMRRYRIIEENKEIKKIITSNLREAKDYDYILNFASYNPPEKDLLENSGIMMLNILIHMGIKEVYIAGMDGYETGNTVNYVHSGLEYDFSEEALLERNNYIKADIEKKQGQITVKFITDSLYC